MKLDNHIAELSRRHRHLDDELDKLRACSSTSDEALADLKRRKLRLKDEIHRLEQQRDEQE